MSKASTSRRRVLKAAAAAVGGGAATLLGGQGVATQAPSSPESPSKAGQRFRAFVRFGTGASVQELKLLPLGPTQVVVRTEAAQICYTTTGPALATSAAMPS